MSAPSVDAFFRPSVDAFFRKIESYGRSYEHAQTHVDLDAGKMAELAAKHFPALAQQSIRHATTSEPSLRDANLALVILTSTITIMPAMSVRFVREYPDLAKDLFYVLARAVKKPFSARQSDDDVIQTALEFQTLEIASLWLTYMCGCASSYPPDYALPIPSDIRKIFGYAVTKVERTEAKLHPRHLPSLPSICLYAGTVAANDQIRLAGIRDAHEGMNQWSYWSCEDAIGEEGSPRCVKLNEGQEMSVCGRCLSVRYCSIGHQKRDWKRHKIDCFKPSW